MTNQDFTPENNEPPVEGGIPTDRRPLGYWLRVVDGLISREFASAFAEEDASRRDWMLLSVLSGDVDAPGLADRIARRGKRLRTLADRGWVTEVDGAWQLTDEGRAAQERLAELVQNVREKVAGAVSDEDYATMTASLEAIARQLGWDESTRVPRGRRFGGRSRGFGFGPGFGPRFGGFAAGRFGDFGDQLTDEQRAAWAERMAHRGFGPGFGHGPHGFGGHPHADGHGAAADTCGHGHGHAHHRGHGHGHTGHGRPDHRGHGTHDGRKSERAYERGFEAGFRAAGRPDAAEAASDPAV